MSNSLTHALPYPIRNARFTLPLSFRTASGTPTDPTTPDTEFSNDGGATFSDCAEEITTGGANGQGYLTLSGAETNNNVLLIAAKSANCLTTAAAVHPRNLPTIGSGTLSAGSATGGTLGTLQIWDLTNCFIRTTGGTGGGGTGGANNQVRRILTYNTLTGAFTCSAWETTPDNTTTYDVLLPEGVTLGQLKTAQLFANGIIYLDTAVATGGSGIATAPCKTLAAALTAAAAQAANSIHPAPGNSITLAGTPGNLSFVGEAWTLALGGQDCAGTTFAGCRVSGICTSSGGVGPYFRDILLDTVTLPPGTTINRFYAFSSSIVTLATGTGVWSFADGRPAAAAGDGYLHLDFNATAGLRTAVVSLTSRALRVQNMADSNYLQVDGIGTVWVDTTSTHAAGTKPEIRLHGNLRLLAGSTGQYSGMQAISFLLTQGFTITYDANYSLDYVERLDRGDKYTDAGVTPWAYVIYQQGTSTELLRERLYKVDGSNVTSTDHVIGEATA